MKKSLLTDPFIFIAGKESFFIGFPLLLGTSWLAYLTGTHFTGLFNINFAKDSDFWIFLVENLSSWILVSLILYIAGILFSKSKIRIVDIFGTILISRIPLLITPAIRTIPLFQSFVVFSVTMYSLIIIYIFSLIWAVALAFNAYKVSCNVKNETLTMSFIACIILSEVLTKLTLHYLT